MKPNTAGYTTVELLVALAIISVLSAIVLSAVFQAWGKARATNCLSNLHQINLALSSYSADNDGHFPPVSVGSILLPKPPEVRYSWAAVIGIAKLSAPLTCPDKGMDSRFESKSYTWQMTGYAISRNLQQTPSDGKGGYVWQGINEALVKYPATTVAVFDAMPDTIASHCPDI